MKKISAAFIVIAVLNPLCCCFSFSEDADPVVAINSHTCCSGENQQEGSERHGSSDCQHKMLLNEDAQIAQEQGIQAIHSLAHHGQVIELLDPTTLHNHHRGITHIRISNAVIDSWLRTQTDCVRLL